MRIVLRVLAAALFASPTFGQQGGDELSPYFKDNDHKFVGTFFRNHAYIVRAKSGSLGGELAGGTFVTDLVSVREKIVILLRRPSDNRFAIMELGGQAANNSASSELEFVDAQPGSLLASSWEKAVNAQTLPANHIKGKQQTWIFVDSETLERSIERYNVGTEVKTESKSGLQFTPLLILIEERSTMYIDPKNRKFASVTTDLFGTPLDAFKYREMTLNGLADKVWKLIKSQPSR